MVYLINSPLHKAQTVTVIAANNYWDPVLDLPDNNGNLNWTLRQNFTKDRKTINSCQNTTESSKETTNGSGLCL